jgi:hypothetical protein
MKGQGYSGFTYTKFLAHKVGCYKKKKYKKRIIKQKINNFIRKRCFIGWILKQVISLQVTQLITYKN